MPKIVDHDERRRVIVEALWRVVSRDGANAVSVRNVAAEAGMPKSSIAHYVGTMPELIGMAVQEMVQAVTDQAMAIDLMALTPETAVDVIMLTIPTDAKRRQMSEVWLLLLSQRNAEPDLGPILTGLNENLTSALREMLSGMRSQGLLDPQRDIELEAQRLHALIDGLSVQSLTDPEFLTSDDVRRIVTMHVAELGARFPAMTG